MGARVRAHVRVSVGAWVCARGCERTRAHTHVNLCMAVEGLPGKKCMGVVGRAYKPRHETANAKAGGSSKPPPGRLPPSLLLSRLHFCLRFP